MHRFFLLLIVWILVEAYWISPKTESGPQHLHKTRSAQSPCVGNSIPDSLENRIGSEILE